MKDWLIKKDIQFNEFLGGNKGETISSRLGRHIMRDNCFLCRLFCRVILLPLGILINRDYKHCRDSIQKRYKQNG